MKFKKKKIFQERKLRTAYKYENKLALRLSKYKKIVFLYTNYL